jgi:cephalosporin hydroxylase
VFDTIVDEVPGDLYPDRPWGPDNNPKSATREYLRRLDSEGRKAADGLALHFETDKAIDHKLLITVTADGFLKRVAA